MTYGTPIQTKERTATIIKDINLIKDLSVKQSYG